MTRLLQQWPVTGGRGWLVALAGAFCLLAALAFLDAELSQLAQGLPQPVVTAFEWITLLGQSEYVLISSAMLCLVAGAVSLVAARPLIKRATLEITALSGFLFCGVGLPSLLSAIVKRMIGRSRPGLFEDVGAYDFRSFNLLDWTYQSFPSGHATTGFALCFAVSFLAPRTFPWMLALALLISVSRIVVGAHYPTDIVGGAIMGTLGAYLVRNVFAWRGMVFEVGTDGRVLRKPLDALAALVRRRA